MAQAMIAGAEGDRRLKPGDAIVEYTGGSTGASLALVAAAKGYRLKIVSSRAFSEEKLTQMAAFGAELTLVETGRAHHPAAHRRRDRRRQGHQRRTPHLLDRSAQQPRQHRRLSADGRRNLGAGGGKVDAFVQSIGTAGFVAGRRRRAPPSQSQVKIVAVEPAESAVLSGGKPGAPDRRHRHRLCPADVGAQPGRRNHSGLDRRCRSHGPASCARGSGSSPAPPQAPM